MASCRCLLAPRSPTPSFNNLVSRCGAFKSVAFKAGTLSIISPQVAGTSLVSSPSTLTPATLVKTVQATNAVAGTSTSRPGGFFCIYVSKLVCPGRSLILHILAFIIVLDCSKIRVINPSNLQTFRILSATKLQKITVKTQNPTFPVTIAGASLAGVNLASGQLKAVGGRGAPITVA